MFARPLALNRALVAAAAARREAGAAALRVSCAAEHSARAGGAPSCERVVADMTAGAGRLTGWEPPAGYWPTVPAAGQAEAGHTNDAWAKQQVSVTHRGIHGFRDTTSLAATRESREGGGSRRRASPD